MSSITTKKYLPEEFVKLALEMDKWHSQVDALEAAHYDETFIPEDRDLSDIAYTITLKMKNRLLKPEKEDLVMGTLDVSGKLQALVIFSFSLSFPYQCLVGYIATHPNNLKFSSIRTDQRIAGAASAALKAIAKIALIHASQAEIHAQSFEVSLPFWGKNHFVKSTERPEGKGLVPVVLKNGELLKLCSKEEEKDKA